MATREIIEIDRTLCNGCGLCTSACAEGALKIDQEGKAALVKEIYCDGLGACLDVCPTGALKVVKKESAPYNAGQTYQHVLKEKGREAAASVHGAQAPLPCGCPGTLAKEISRESRPQTTSAETSELSNWPIQLQLVSPHAPYFNGSDLLVAADCTAFSLGKFHSELLKGKKLVIACPKLDETSGYAEKLADILRHNKIYSLTLVIMEVPCCSGLFRLLQKAVELSGEKINIKKIVVGLDGSIK
ncbi:MAG: 4Fe-4S binding protein [Candidatus Margulisbacteria bacterium]|nr:4Fe-4S binding protein [Candidatus Margulisiibacteriota bacterium]